MMERDLLLVAVCTAIVMEKGSPVHWSALSVTPARLRQQAPGLAQPLRSRPEPSPTGRR